MRFLSPLSLILPLAMSACAVHGIQDALEEETLSFDFDDSPDVLRVVSDTASVRIVGGNAQGAAVAATLKWFGDARPEVMVSLEDGVLYVASDCPDRGQCAVEFEIDVPHSADADLEIAVGSLEAVDLDGDLYLESETGSAELDGLTGRLELHLGTGSIQGWDLESTEAQFSTCTGSVEARFEVEPSVDAETCTGSVELSVPAGDYRLDVQTQLGGVEIRGVNDREDAEHSLRAHTNVGSVEVTGR